MGSDWTKDFGFAREEIFRSEETLRTIADEERTEILDIRADAETMARSLDFEHYFPGYHMNKRTWLTVRLDGSVPFGEIAPLIARSYELAGKK